MAGPAALDGLRQRFAALWTRCLLPGCGESPDAAWRAIAAGYGAHERHYHSSAHLAFCLAELDVARALATDPDALETAIWFHDVVLDPGAGDNETRSCALFEELAGGKLAPDLRRRVCSLILATTHRGTVAAGDEQLMADIDLASLGKDWPRFLQDCRALRAESRAGPDAYAAAKLRFFDSLLARPRIFATDFFHARYEDLARANVARFSAMLRNAEFR